MKLECVTGTKPIYVYQDFHAQLLTYNIVHDMMRDAQKNIEEKRQEKEKRFASMKILQLGYSRKNS